MKIHKKILKNFSLKLTKKSKKVPKPCKKNLKNSKNMQKNKKSSHIIQKILLIFLLIPKNQLSTAKTIKNLPKNGKKIRIFDLSNLLSVQMCSFVLFFYIKLEYVHFFLIFKVLKSYAISL